MTDYVVSVKQAFVPLVNGRTVIVSRGYQVPADALPATVTHLLAIGAIEAGEGAAIGGIGPDLDGEGNPIGAAPSPTPPPYVRTVNGQGPDVAGDVEAGGGGITIPANTGGVVGGMLGLEYNGAGYAIGGATKTITFDTYYLDPATADSSPFTVGDAPVETDDLTLDLTSGSTIQVKADGLYAVYVSLFLSAALTHAAYVQVHGQLGANGRVWLPIGANSYDFNVAVALRADDLVMFSLGGVNAADQATNVSYAVLAAAKVG